MSYTKKTTSKKAAVSNSDNTEIADYIKAVRAARGMSQREFAKHLGIPAANGSHIHHVETGRYRYPYEFISRLTRFEKEVALRILAKYQREDVVL
jgi:transcriptional regulator with XRE-family HTH domain